MTAINPAAVPAHWSRSWPKPPSREAWDKLRDALSLVQDRWMDSDALQRWADDGGRVP